MLPHGKYSVNVVTNSSTTNASTITQLEFDFQGNHIVNCPQLGQEGRFYQDGDYIVLAFGSGQDIPLETHFNLFGTVDPSGLYQGVMIENLSGQVYGWEARSGGPFPPSTDFGPGPLLPTWPGSEFIGREMPYPDEESFYRFRYDGSHTGTVSVGKTKGGETFTAPFATTTLLSSNTQLLVFGTDNLRTYGAVVNDMSNDQIILSNGLYMHPFIGNGKFDIWDAHS